MKKNILFIAAIMLAFQSQAQKFDLQAERSQGDHA
jgi:glycerophosphoryl diester phosphodiesterase